MSEKIHAGFKPMEAPPKKVGTKREAKPKVEETSIDRMRSKLEARRAGESVRPPMWMSTCKHYPSCNGLVFRASAEKPKSRIPCTKHVRRA